MLQCNPPIINRLGFYRSSQYLIKFIKFIKLADINGLVSFDSESAVTISMMETGHSVYSNSRSNG